MSRLLKDLFERDLSPAEFESLLREVEASPQKAMDLARRAAEAYAALGLETPALRKPWFKSPWLAAMGAVAALSGAWLAWTPREAPRILPGVMAPPQAAEKSLKALPPPPPLGRITPLPQLAPRMEMELLPAEEGLSHLLVKVRTFRPGGLSLVVEDALQRPLQVLYQGELEAGEHRFEWNARNAQGMAAGPGLYFVRMDYAQGHELRALQVDLRIGD